jgi:hypothetical protein
MPKKKKINLTLDQEYQQLTLNWRPVFDNQDDIDIFNYAQKLITKSLTADEIDSLKSKAVYLLKKRVAEARKTRQLSKRGV